MVRTLAVLWLTMAVVGSGPALGQTPAPKPDMKANAALKYWQAFALLPPLNKDRNQILDAWETVELVGPVLPLIEESKNALMLLHRGALMDHCDWGLSKEDGPDLLMPHLSKARELSKYAFLRARYQFAVGKSLTAIDDLMDTLAFARHLGTDSVFVGLLVEYSLETQAIDTLAKYLPDLDVAASQHLTKRLNSLPRGGNFKDGLRAEKEVFIGGSIRLLKEKRVVPDKGLEALLRAAGGPKGPITLLEELGTFYDEVAKLPPLPRDQFQQRVAELNQKQETNPFAKLVLPALDRVYEAGERTQAKRAMLQAAQEVVVGGREKLKTIRDPFGDGPLEYRALKQGFELTSKVTYKGQPVKLVVGRDKK
jgi:hypothetical protein